MMWFSDHPYRYGFMARGLRFSVAVRSFGGRNLAIFGPKSPFFYSATAVTSLYNRKHPSDKYFRILFMV